MRRASGGRQVRQRTRVHLLQPLLVELADAVHRVGNTLKIAEGPRAFACSLLQQHDRVLWRSRAGHPLQMTL